MNNQTNERTEWKYRLGKEEKPIIVTIGYATQSSKDPSVWNPFNGKVGYFPSEKCDLGETKSGSWIPVVRAFILKYVDSKKDDGTPFTKALPIVGDESESLEQKLISAYAIHLAMQKKKQKENNKNKK